LVGKDRVIQLQPFFWVKIKRRCGGLLGRL
jgi:hypothetical protein